MVDVRCAPRRAVLTPPMPCWCQHMSPRLPPPQPPPSLPQLSFTQLTDPAQVSHSEGLTAPVSAAAAAAAVAAPCSRLVADWGQAVGALHHAGCRKQHKHIG